MTVIKNIISALHNLKDNSSEMVIEVLKEKGDLVADLNREQLLRGEDASGKFITPKYRNKKYAQRKQQLNSKPPAGTPDIKLTGKYHKSLKEKYTGEEITVQSPDKKDERLTDKYGPIKGLNDVSLSNLREEILPDLRIKFYESI